MFVSNCAFLSEQAKNTISPGDRHKVARFMCHDTSTADKFYALNLDAKQALEQRALFQAAVEGEDAPPGTPESPTTTTSSSSRRKASGKQRKRPAPSASPPDQDTDQEQEKDEEQDQEQDQEQDKEKPSTSVSLTFGGSV